jgi:hypothetical protein
VRRREPPAEEVEETQREQEDAWLHQQVRWARASASPLPWLVPDAPSGSNPLEEWAVVVEAYAAHDQPLPAAVPTGQAKQHALFRAVRSRLREVGLPCPVPLDPREMLREA